MNSTGNIYIETELMKICTLNLMKEDFTSEKGFMCNVFYDFIDFRIIFLLSYNIDYRLGVSGKISSIKFPKSCGLDGFRRVFGFKRCLETDFCCILEA